MRRKLDVFVAIFIMISITNSMVYYQPSHSQNEDIVEEKEDTFTPKDLISDYSQPQADSKKKPDSELLRTTIEGDYELQGFFTCDDYVSLDADGSVLELEKYDDMKSDSPSAISKLFSMYRYYDDDDIRTFNWPSQSDTYYPLKHRNTPETLSTMFTPVFDESALIKGKVHILTHFETSSYSSITVTLRLQLHIFNPLNGNLTEILSYDEPLPSGLSGFTKRIYEPELNSTYSIPIGSRLKLSVETKVSNLSGRARIQLESSSKGSGQYTWNIDDNEYSNSYTFPGFDRILGMQIQYIGADYPEIAVSGITNTSYYHEEKNINITTVNAVSSSYSWDNGTSTSFTDFATTLLPATEGWHYLEVIASDGYNNTIIVVYEVGYDPTESYLLLYDTLNNTIIDAHSYLNFSTYGANEVSYEWDNSGSVLDLLILSGYDIPILDTEGFHNLTLYLNDTFVYEEYFYLFGIDSNTPIVELINVSNDTVIAANKLIEVNVTDYSSNLDVHYKWDDNIFLPWSASEDTTYITYSPTSSGIHNLTVTAEDPFGHYTEQYFSFNISTTALLVELRTLKNDSFYFGSNLVEVSISGTNGTILFQWDDTGFQDGTIFLVSGTILTLSGINALPSDPSSYHTLTIIVGSTTHVETIFLFVFNIDQETPSIDPSILDYNDARFTSEEIFIFTITDNSTLESELLVLVSINGGANQTLDYSFELSLNSFADGFYTLLIIVYDIAGNNISQMIQFYVDSSPPVVNTIEFWGLVSLSDGSMYIPSGSLVQTSFLDTDSTVDTTYSWDGSLYQSFSSSFTLSYPDGQGTLIINASDSLGNEIILIYEITIDSQAPVITLSFPIEFSTINSETNLNFHITDVSISTINLIEFYWDALIYPVPALPDSNGDFEIGMVDLYNTDDEAILRIYTEDIVGNNATYFFTFEVDVTSPDPTLYVYDILTDSYYNALIVDYLVTGTTLWYDNTSSPDLAVFLYYWGTNSEQQLSDPWEIAVPSTIGVYNLTMILQDSTGEGTSPNEVVLIHTFTIKSEGSITFLESSVNTAIFGENISVDITFSDLDANELTITKILANGTEMEVVDLGNHIYRFLYPTHLTTTKGIFILHIYVESDFHFGYTNDSYTFDIEISPIPLSLTISVSDLEIIQGTQVVITGNLSRLDGTPVEGMQISFIISLYLKSNVRNVVAATEGWDNYDILNDTTNSAGIASISYLLSEDIDHIEIEVFFVGSDTLGDVFLKYDQIVNVIKAGLSPAILYSIIGVSIFLLILVAFIVYKASKRKPFDKYLSKVSSQDLIMRLNELCPGVILSIFDQKKGPIPLISEHAFDYDYGGRIAVGTDNFLLKICDQAYSTLGFEDVHQGRKTSALNLPNEGLVGFVHAIQLENTKARGGFENLSVIIMTQSDYGNYLLTYSEHFYSEIDGIISHLKSKKPLSDVKEQLLNIRQRAVQVILAAIEENK